MSEATSLAQTQQLMRTIFACIAYLRDLFPENYFTDDEQAGMRLKKLKLGAHCVVDRFIGWIESGCFDALARKYVSLYFKLRIVEEHSSCDCG